MSLDLRLAERPVVAGVADELVAEARDFLATAEAEGTRRNYATDWRAFMAWCAAHGFESLPADAEVVALYLTDFARDHKASTVVRRAVGIAKGHRRAGYLSLKGPSTRRRRSVGSDWTGGGTRGRARRKPAGRDWPAPSGPSV